MTDIDPQADIELARPPATSWPRMPLAGTRVADDPGSGSRPRGEHLPAKITRCGWCSQAWERTD